MLEGRRVVKLSRFSRHLRGQKRLRSRRRHIFRLIWLAVIVRPVRLLRLRIKRLALSVQVILGSTTELHLLLLTALLPISLIILRLLLVILMSSELILSWLNLLLFFLELRVLRLLLILVVLSRTTDLIPCPIVVLSLLLGLILSLGGFKFLLWHLLLLPL